MHKILFLILFSSLHSYFCVAQKPNTNPRPNRMEILKMAFVTKELNLTTNEAQKFWPVYNSYIRELRQARRNYNDDELGYTEAALKIGKEYQPQFKAILGTDERVNATFGLERKFREMLRKELLIRQKQTQVN